MSGMSSRIAWQMFVGSATALSLMLAGCASRSKPPALVGEPIGLQMLRIEPELRQQRFNTLLDFETERDQVFVELRPKPPRVRAGRPAGGEAAHTGSGVLELPRGTRQVAVKLPLLLGGRAFPGDWTLAGAYLRSPHAGQIDIAYEVDGRALAHRNVALEPGAWSPVLLDLAQVNDPNRPAAAGAVGLLTLTFDRPIESDVRMDDVVLIDNTRSLVGDAGATSDGLWSIRQKGFRIYGDQPGRFRFALDTPESSPADGWTVEEANEMRARFRSEGSACKTLTVYADGRAYWDGQFKPMSTQQDAQVPLYRQQHQSPAEIEVPDETLGRVDRNTQGDANNDGYNEAQGAYQLIANGPRLEARIVPRTAALVRPVFEIAGLDGGNVLVTLEGQLVQSTCRLDNGNLLVELPVKIERPASVQFRVH